ncbi:unnamed protein product [Dibothriocephalus latus]|uniref:Uncharacterized protein n=1 Tax=Dibothriocephalus latus TaxID=60516 RepID=A0A3P7QS56_DIBLA|nr:unnamed protein product [Dibothriocephalus latus]
MGEGWLEWARGHGQRVSAWPQATVGAQAKGAMHQRLILGSKWLLGATTRSPVLQVQLNRRRAKESTEYSTDWVQQRQNVRYLRKSPPTHPTESCDKARSEF